MRLFKIITSKVNIGLGRALNLGLKNCSNRLVARMDTDDISLPERCEKQVCAFEADPTLDIVGTMIDDFIDDPKVVTSSRIFPTEHEAICKFDRRRSA